MQPKTYLCYNKFKNLETGCCLVLKNKMKKQHYILISIILIYLVFVIISASQLYRGDEVIFLIAAKDIVENQQTFGRISFANGLLDNSTSINLVHSPLYFYLLGLFMVIFGESMYSMRAVSTIFQIGSIILVYFLTKLILQKREVKNTVNYSLLASFIYALIPLTIQSSIILDIDGGLLTFFILLFLYFYISNKSLAYLIPSLFMVFASKEMTGVLILFTSLIILNILSLDWKKLFRTIKLFIITTILFFLTFIGYAELFNLNWRSLFEHNSILSVIIRWTKAPSFFLIKSLWGLKLMTYFIIPFTIFLFIMLSYEIIKKINYGRFGYIKQNKDVLLLWIYSLVVIGFYFVNSVTGWNFPKYYAILTAPMIILIIYFTSRMELNFKRLIPISLITLILLLGYFIFFVGDPLIPEITGRIKTTSLQESIKPVLIRFLTYVIIPIVLCAGLFKKIQKNKLWVVLLFLLIFTSFYIAIIQSKADYSTHNIYGDKGLEEVISFMNAVPPSEILGYIHLGYYLGYEETYELTTIYNNETILKEVFEKVNYIILYQKDIDLIGEETLKEFKLEKEIYDYKILRKINAE